MAREEAAGRFPPWEDQPSMSDEMQMCEHLNRHEELCHNPSSYWTIQVGTCVLPLNYLGDHLCS